ncbi:MAG: replication-associated recombination protein A [Candidatus Krumholzibacteria bacterium]|nr:replication-associated recombination protein A [Candidatus Krumholzibacteria bacterium]MDH5270322.1 replication-associated recombination protein A [Candidatus Krumholzibacteria bacterium]
MSDSFELLPENSSRHDSARPTPLADRMRARDLDEFVGQEKIVGPSTLLRQTLEAGVITQSMILWGPPGCGKTTLARLIAARVKNRFVPFSAVTSGIAEVKRVIADARKLRSVDPHPLLLFVDEIHRFNRAQQDAFLPHIEDGTIVFIGATTENPSFEVIGPLLSRSRVFVFEMLGPEQVTDILRRALADRERGLGEAKIEAEDGVLEMIADVAQGDARVALNALEYASSVIQHQPQPRRLTKVLAMDALQRRTLSTDRAGESHYNLISALHKSLRGGDTDASLYWLARMCEAGEDPVYIARRLVRFASEDVGNADPQALVVSIAARDAVEFIGYPECKLALAQCVIYLALAEKSNAIYTAYGKAADVVNNTPPHPVPLHIRNAPTPMMKDLGYGKDYVYPHDHPDAAPQDFLPDALRGSRFYHPREAGFEAELKQRLEAFRKRRSG